jgi:hypothetical protein
MKLHYAATKMHYSQQVNNKFMVICPMDLFFKSLSQMLLPWSLLAYKYKELHEERLRVDKD